MMGLSDSLYYYLKARLPGVEVVYKAPPVQVPPNPAQLAEVLMGVERLALVATTPALDDLDRVVRIVAEYTQLTPTAKTQLLKALASV